MWYVMKKKIQGLKKLTIKVLNQSSYEGIMNMQNN